MSEQYDAFVRSLRALDQHQRDHYAARQNKPRQAEIVAHIKAARTVADTCADLLQATLERHTTPAFPLPSDASPAERLLHQYGRAQSAFKSAWRDKSESNWKRLRAEEKALRAILKTA